MTSVHLSILIHKGDPLDYPHYRHTALWLEFGDGTPPLKVHVVGTQGLFVFDNQVCPEPWEAEGFVRKIDVGHLEGEITAAQAVGMLKGVTIQNRDREFNCQTWVDHALQMFKGTGQLSEASYDQGIDGMIDAISEAEDVEE